MGSEPLLSPETSSNSSFWKKSKRNRTVRIFFRSVIKSPTVCFNEMHACEFDCKVVVKALLTFSHYEFQRERERENYMGNIIFYWRHIFLVGNGMMDQHGVSGASQGKLGL